MITIKTTPNRFGISLQGDYHDLNALYDSIARYLELYMANNKFYPYHEYEYLLSLNYDIRHAYMGTRDVEILYPLVFHYLANLSEITYEDPTSDWFDNLPKHMSDYNMIHANRDRAMILHFTSLLWENIQDVLGSRQALAAMECYENNEEFVLAPSLYTDALIHWQLAHFGKLSEEDKSLFLLKSLYEIIDVEDLLQSPNDYKLAYNHYKEASESIMKKGLPVFPEKEAFYQLLDGLLSTGEPLYESTFDAFLNTHYGVITDEYPEM